MRIDNIMTKSILILGCAMALIACESSETDAETGTPDPDTQEEDNNNNNNNNDNDTQDVGNMLPAGYDLENCDSFAFDPCGGDIVGTWSATGACMVAPDGEDMGPGPGGEFSDPSCPAQQAGIRMSMAGTTLNFNADLSYNHSLAFGMEMAVWRPSACDQGVSCDLLQSALNEEGDDDSEEGSGGDEGEEEDEGMSMDWTCSSKNDGCLCIAIGSEAPEQESGTYTTPDNTVVMAIEAEEGEDEDGAPPFKYCVDGTTLQFEAVAPADEPIQMFITFDKQ